MSERNHERAASWATTLRVAEFNWKPYIYAHPSTYQDFGVVAQIAARGNERAARAVNRHLLRKHEITQHAHLTDPVETWVVKRYADFEQDARKIGGILMSSMITMTADAAQTKAIRQILGDSGRRSAIMDGQRFPCLARHGLEICARFKVSDPLLLAGSVLLASIGPCSEGFRRRFELKFQDKLLALPRPSSDVNRELRVLV